MRALYLCSIPSERPSGIMWLDTLRAKPVTEKNSRHTPNLKKNDGACWAWRITGRDLLVVDRAVELVIMQDEIIGGPNAEISGVCPVPGSAKLLEVFLQDSDNVASEAICKRWLVGQLHATCLHTACLFRGLITASLWYTVTNSWPLTSFLHFSQHTSPEVGDFHEQLLERKVDHNLLFHVTVRSLLPFPPMRSASRLLPFHSLLALPFLRRRYSMHHGVRALSQGIFPSCRYGFGNPAS
ncbi:hypothetical protein K470DRAFT_287505 [Piedraia hortae CBS 480.64]|uniref:Uncharacterized protein n=1 Tax=Piedraia hortae CBS 480.64 TaxID=1314780 RepID=A0A6A7BYW5_9PEZI|nr:hypothetical protein K470DRAFT_287505 [Piedraia hortae CBS 480.64]